jgi:ubiquinol-cytochrome c reductase iron-sulfur subunit
MAKNTVGSFIASMMPNRGLMAVANVEIDLDEVPEGKSVTFDWRGKPLFVRHREQWEIDEGTRSFDCVFRDGFYFYDLLFYMQILIA